MYFIFHGIDLSLYDVSSSLFTPQIKRYLKTPCGNTSRGEANP